MAKFNIYAGTDEEKLQVDTNLSKVSELLDLETYKGPSSSAFIRWIGKQDPVEVAKALRKMRENELASQLKAMKQK